MNEQLLQFNEIARFLRKVKLPDVARKLEEELRPIVECDLSKFRITVIGKQNSGKSTLLNVLCGFFDREHFPTGDRIVTKKIDEFEYNDMVFVDTPGLDATQEDEDEANTVLKNGAALFLHSCLTGELDGEECKSLERLVREFDQPQRQIAVLCSKIGDAGGDVGEVIDRVRVQAREIVGDELTFIAIDSIEYRHGCLESEARLVKHSHISEVKDWIETARKVPNKLEGKFTSEWAKVSRSVKVQKEAAERRLKECKRDKENLCVKLHDKWKELRRQWSP
jgi:energy-coupling factor transporter ATP-binding protein EcfA2